MSAISYRQESASTVRIQDSLMTHVSKWDSVRDLDAGCGLTGGVCDQLPRRLSTLISLRASFSAIIRRADRMRPTIERIVVSD